MEKSPQLMTCAEAAQMLGLSTDGVKALVDRGRLRAIRTVGRRSVRLFFLEDVQSLAAERQRRTPSQ